ncbi:MAG: hypothetical protein OXD40_09500 [bacterium]|nr:hypothetical protein [bacterium]
MNRILLAALVAAGIVTAPVDRAEAQEFSMVGCYEHGWMFLPSPPVWLRVDDVLAMTLGTDDDIVVHVSIGGGSVQEINLTDRDGKLETQIIRCLGGKDLTWSEASDIE